MPGDDPGPIELHRSIEYAVVHFPDQAAHFLVCAAADGRQTVVQGVCPGCGGRTKTVWPVGSGNGYKGIFGGSSAKVPVRLQDRTRLVNCECGHAHAQRPDTAPFHGCGANWLIELP
jgi:hypothetical protein